MSIRVPQIVSDGDFSTSGVARFSNKVFVAELLTKEIIADEVDYNIKLLLEDVGTKVFKGPADNIPDLWKDGLGNLYDASFTTVGIGSFHFDNDNPRQNYDHPYLNMLSPNNGSFKLHIDNVEMPTNERDDFLQGDFKMSKITYDAENRYVTFEVWFTQPLASGDYQNAVLPEPQSWIKISYRGYFDSEFTTFAVQRQKTIWNGSEAKTLNWSLSAKFYAD